MVKKSTLTEDKVSLIKEKKIFVSENIWNKIKDERISIFNLPPQPVQTIVHLPVSFAGSNLLVKLKVPSALISLETAFPLLNFTSSLSNYVIISEKTDEERKILENSNKYVVSPGVIR